MQGIILQEKKRIFNYRLSRARRYIKCFFGILVNKWRVLHRPVNVSKKLSKDIVKACVNRMKHSQIADKYEMRTLQNLPRSLCNRPSRTTNDLKDRFADNFVSTEGVLPLQLKKIYYFILLYVIFSNHTYNYSYTIKL